MVTSLKLRVTQSTDLDNRWLKFSTFDDASFGDGAWSETVKPGITYKIDPDTMPLIIYRAAQDVFFVGPADGKAEEQTVRVRSTSTHSQAGVIAQLETTRHHLIQSSSVRRSGITSSSVAVTWSVAAETVQFSETDDIFNFFVDSSLSTQATDPFGLRGTSERSSPIEWMIPVEDSILAFSSTSQFQVRAADADVLTPLTGSIFG